MWSSAFGLMDRMVIALSMLMLLSGGVGMSPPPDTHPARVLLVEPERTSVSLNFIEASESGTPSLKLDILSRFSRARDWRSARNLTVAGEPADNPARAKIGGREQQ
jgi:hypothetical protein